MTAPTILLDDKLALAAYINSKLTNKTQLKLNKTVYLCFKEYAGTYGDLEAYNAHVPKDQQVDATDMVLPDYLFDGHFEAWKFGPIERDINNAYGDLPPVPDFDSQRTGQAKAILEQIDHIIDQVNTIDDFSLVNLTQSDPCWTEAYRRNNKERQPYTIAVIPNADIKRDMLNQL